MGKRLRAFASLLMVASTFVSPAQAKAASPCFAEIADSAWANGEPDSVKIALGFDLIGKITTSEEDLARYFDPSSFENGMPTNDLVFKLIAPIYGEYLKYVHYSYEGRSCTRRDIYIYGPSSTSASSEVPLSQLIDSVKKNSINYQDADKGLAIIQKLQKALQNYSLTFPITKDLLPNFGPYTAESGMKFRDSTSRLPMNDLFVNYGIAGLVEFNSKCLIFKNIYKGKNISQQPIKPKYEMIRAYFPIGGPVGVYPIFSSKNAKCVGKLFLTSIQWKENNSLIPPNTIVYIDKIMFVAKISNKK